MFYNVDMVELVKTSNQMREQLKRYKSIEPDLFEALDTLARHVYQNYVRGKMDSMDFAVFAAMLSLQSAEHLIKERATVECQGKTVV